MIRTCERRLTWCMISKPSSVLKILLPAGEEPIPALLQRMSNALPVSNHRVQKASTVDSFELSSGHHSMLVL